MGKNLLLLFIILLFLFVMYNKKQREEFRPLRTFYNKKHKFIRRKLSPHTDNLKIWWERFFKKWV